MSVSTDVNRAAKINSLVTEVPALPGLMLAARLDVLDSEKAMRRSPSRTSAMRPMSVSLDGPRWRGVLVGGDGERSGVAKTERVLDFVDRDFRPGLTPRF
jgi:hypothetical protein